MKSTPRSGSRRSASARSLGGPQIPRPTMRIAPKPRRLTSNAPPMRKRPDSNALIMANPRECGSRSGPARLGRRHVALDAETTGKRTPDAEFIRKRPFAWRAPGIIIEVGFVEMLREGEGWRKGETWSSRLNPDGPIDPEAIKIHRIRPADLKNAPRFPTILPKLKDFVGTRRSW